eukprot:TRINITY_DN18329_c0_g1_i1.p1 TRINITY_DN18329_c0_g1~~TRINITY_DN18329_c0_g1_i1.p1  ORF type:complete len:536 (+),score=159.70 TRINITY_DN18329_c0_g1_i1:573-2180(+)
MSSKICSLDGMLLAYCVLLGCALSFHFASKQGSTSQVCSQPSSLDFRSSEAASRSSDSSSAENDAAVEANRVVRQRPLLPAADGRYSNHWCINGVKQDIAAHATLNQEVEDGRKRICAFRNLCYQKGEFVYHRNNDSEVPWEEQAMGEPLWELPPGHGGFVNLHTDVAWSLWHPPGFAPPGGVPVPAEGGERVGRVDAVHWSPTQTYDPIPPDARWLNSSEVYVYMQPVLPWLYSHVLADDTVAIWFVLQAFGLLDVPARLLLHRTCEQLPEPDRRLRCLALQEKVFPSVSDFPSQRPQDLQNGSSTPVCVPLMLAGLSVIGYHNDFNHKADQWAQFRDWALAREGLTTRQAPTPLTGQQPVMTLMRPNGSNVWANHDELLAHLRTTYGSTFEVVDLSPDGLTMRQEMAAMQRTTILIAPTGAVGFGALFLPTHSAAIFGCYCARCHAGSLVDPNATACCYRHDNHLWAYVPYFKALHYVPRDPHLPLGGPLNTTYAIVIRLMDDYIGQALEATGMRPDIWPEPPGPRRSQPTGS